MNLTVIYYLLKVGVGMSMEGIEQNPIVYDLMSEMAFRHKNIDVKVILTLILYVKICIFSSSQIINNKLCHFLLI